jgi:hypothetical protein
MNSISSEQHHIARRYVALRIVTYDHGASLRQIEDLDELMNMGRNRLLMSENTCEKMNSVVHRLGIQFISYIFVVHFVTYDK